MWYHRAMFTEVETQGQVRFRLGRRNQLVLYKQKDESSRHLLLKVAAFALFHREHEGLSFEVRPRAKMAADLAAFDLTGEPSFWVIVDDCSAARLEYVLRHVHCPVALVLQQPDLQAVVVELRRAIHYRYTHGHLTLYNFLEPVAAWLDPEDVAIPEGSYDTFSF